MIVHQFNTPRVCDRVEDSPQCVGLGPYRGNLQDMSGVLSMHVLEHVEQVEGAVCRSVADLFPGLCLQEVLSVAQVGCERVFRTEPWHTDDRYDLSAWRLQLRDDI